MWLKAVVMCWPTPKTSASGLPRGARIHYGEVPSVAFAAR
jgi:hypothetical protein